MQLKRFDIVENLHHLFYDADATHVLALALDPSGHLLAGTGTPGQVLRIDETSRAFVLLDSPFAEIRALHRASDGIVYAVAVVAMSTAPHHGTPGMSGWIER